MNLKLLPLLLILSSCATVPNFRKGEQQGYTVRELDGRKDYLEVTIHLTTEENAHYRGLYLIRAVGEECLSRGFSYFEGDSLAHGSYYGMCFASKDRGTLGIGFEGFPKTGPLEKWEVTDTSYKPETELRVGDQLLSANGRPVKEWAELIGEIFKAYKRGDKTVMLEYVHDGKTRTTQEKLIQLQGEEGRLMGPKDLAEFRSRIP